MKKRNVLFLSLGILSLVFPSIFIAPSTGPDPFNTQREIQDNSACELILDFLPHWIRGSSNPSHFLGNIPPTVTITSPLDGDTVAGTVLITGTANDSDGEIDHVEISIDRGPWINATGTTNWTYQWDTTKENNGICKISAQSYDGADYSSVIAIDVTVNNTPQNTPPVINITSPLEGDTVNNITIINGSAYDLDNDSLNITLRIDLGDWEPVGILIDPPHISWNYRWNTTLVPNGGHTIMIQAHDGYNFIQVSIMVTVTNLNPPPNSYPWVNITSPLDEDFVKGTVTLMGTASPGMDGEIQKIEIRINDGPWNLAMGTTSWSYIWDTRVHPDKAHSISARSYDGSNYSEICTITLTVDNTPSLTIAAVFGTEGNNDWWTSNISITLTGIDNGSGIQDTYYKLNNGEWENYTTPLSVPIEGVHLLFYYSRDAVGNTEPNHSLTLKIDKTNPVTSHTLSPERPTGANDWYTRSVTLSFTRNDSVSWINTTRYRIDNGTWENYSQPLILQDDGIHTVEYYSIDNAGNQETIQIVDIKIDKTPPSIRISKPVTQRLYLFDREIIRLPFQTRILGKITLEVVVTDRTSGIQKVQYIIDYGTRIDVSMAPFHYVYDESALLRHRHVITAKAVDKAGNTNNTDELTIWIFNI